MSQNAAVNDAKDTQDKIDAKDTTDTKDTKDIKDLLGKTTDSITGLSSGNEVDDNPDGKTVEKYFSMKLKNLFEAKDIYSNIKIFISDLLDDINVYIPTKIFENNNLSKKDAKIILKQFKNYFEKEADLEIDLLIPNVRGSKIDSFFKLIKNYSYPETISINPDINYLVIVESTYCLQKNIVKKTEQLRKLFLFFSKVNKLYQEYKNYLEDFYEYFIKKRLLSEPSVKNTKIQKYKKNGSLNLSNFDNFIILFASNSQLKLFQEVSVKIHNISLCDQKEKELGIGQDVIKCFQYPYNPKQLNEIDKKKFSNENDENIGGSSNSEEIKPKNLIENSFRKFQYLIENINKEKNFKVKLIYFDLYLNVTAPKSEIIKQIDDLKKIILINEAKLNKTNEELNKTNEELDKTNEELDKTKNKMLEMDKTIMALVNHIRKNDPNFKIDDMKDNMK